MSFDAVGFGIVARVVLGPFLSARERKTHARAQALALQKNADEIRCVPSFKADVEWIGGLDEDAVAIDIERRLIAISSRGATATLLRFDQILFVQALRDGEILHGTDMGNSTAGAAAGAAIGGLLLGGVGLVGGMLAGAQRGFKKTRKLSLRLSTRDLHMPIAEIVFFCDQKGVERNDPRLRERAALLDGWLVRLQAAASSQVVNA